MDAINTPVVNFASATNNCTPISGSTLVSCPDIAADIATCQTKYGKTILISVGGATYTEGGFTSAAAAVTAANNVWASFGPYSDSAARPFGKSVVNGFDFDFESTMNNGEAFAQQLRTLMDGATAPTGGWMLTAAPQCPFPDASDNLILSNVKMDAVFVQFYNNYCGVQSYVAGSTTQNNFDMNTWDTWAKGSKNPDVKVFLGVPASSTAAGSGYESASALAAVIAYSKTFSSFGGVMMWDASQAYANTGFLDGISSALGGSSGSTGSGTTTKSSTSTKVSTTLSTATKTTTASGGSTTGVAQWGQCGGIGYTGSTVCATGLKCVAGGAYWSSCQ